MDKEQAARYLVNLRDRLVVERHGYRNSDTDELTRVVEWLTKEEAPYKPHVLTWVVESQQGSISTGSQEYGSKVAAHRAVDRLAMTVLSNGVFRPRLCWSISEKD